MKEGSSSPWGKVQHAKELAPGAWTVETAGHGGVKLNAARNRLIPAEARQPGGWYEEDCKWAIAAFVFKDVRDAILSGIRSTYPGLYDGTTYLETTIKRWESDDVTSALGIA